MSKIPLQQRNENIHIPVDISLLQQLKQSNDTVRRGVHTRRITRKPLSEQKINTHKKKPSMLSSESAAKSYQKPKLEREITLGLPIQSSKRNSMDDIFSVTDTPVHNLPIDCLILIFELLKDFDDRRMLTCTCRRWRSIAMRPFLWREARIKWDSFSRQVEALRESQAYFEPLQYIQKMTIVGDDVLEPRQLGSRPFKTQPFTQLHRLHLIGVDLPNIVFLTNWLRHITKLYCDNIQATEKHSINMCIFSKCSRLEHLRVRFNQPCHLSYYGPVLHTDGYFTRQVLPNTLKKLSVHNIFDYENDVYDVFLDRVAQESGLTDDEFMQREQNVIIGSWRDMEDQLVKKYIMLASLHRLRMLSLGNVSSFTSRVWRECLKPSGGKLEYLTMENWSGRGKRESPQRILERQNDPEAPRNATDDVEMAIAEYISSLSNLKVLRVNAFYCGEGLMNGVKGLKKKYKLYKADNPEQANSIGPLQYTMLTHLKLVVV